MSELKTRRFFEAVPTSKEGFYQPGAFVDGYLKSEADKCIMKLKTDLVRWEGYAYLGHGEYLREILHQKRKRCLAMAMWCDAEGCWYENQGEDIKASWFFKWEHKWLELAEKFKEAK